ncbi:transcription factor SPT20 homolog [Pieris brassicae]|uniref:transcription factor SPT20 homolog n=1 Tax=Pieris brassicae TaxID=7116 RepID=UPI001E66137A|nr:transcription factor SPT20 homolog [Pieris brassicae]
MYSCTILKSPCTQAVELLVLLSLAISSVVCEAPYPPSGWRPDGPSFDLPQKPQKQEYLPVDPRRPANPSFDNGVDVSVQGLPTVEQQPIFQVSPINGQLFSAPSINADIRNLDPSFRQIQYQQQQQKAQEFARQREFDAKVRNSNGLPSQQVPRQFVQTTTVKPEFKTAEPTTETFDLNSEEVDTNEQKQNVSVEVTKQNVQEYPPELFLSPLTQLKSPQLVSLQQLGQLRAPLYQPIQSSNFPGFDGPAHLSALPSVLVQKQLLEQQTQPLTQNPIIVQEPLREPINQYQQINQYQPQIQAFPFQPQPVVYQPQAISPAQTNQFAQPQYQPSQVPQPNPDVENIEPTEQTQTQPQYQTPVFIQPQAQPIQPNQFIQPNFAQPNPYAQPNQFVQPSQVQPNIFPQAGQFQSPIIQPNQYYQPQFVQAFEQQQSGVDQQAQQPQIFYQNVQPQYYQPSQYQDQAQANQYDIQNQYAQAQGQVALQSGINDPQDNSLDTEELDENEGNRATAVATAFGTRTQPRVVPTYGAPAPVPAYQTTTEANDESVTEDGAVAQATAVASGRRKSAKLRSRRIRPVFTVDRSGHLVLAQEQ